MNETLSRLVDSGVVAVLRGVEADQLIEITEALRDGGVTAVEITADTPNVAEKLSEVAGSFDDGRRGHQDGPRQRDRQNDADGRRGVRRLAEPPRGRDRDVQPLRASAPRRDDADRGNPRLRGRCRLREGVSCEDRRAGPPRRDEGAARPDPDDADRRRGPRQRRRLHIDAGAFASARRAAPSSTTTRRARRLRVDHRDRPPVRASG